MLNTKFKPKALKEFVKKAKVNRYTANREIRSLALGIVRPHGQPDLSEPNSLFQFREKPAFIH